MVSGNGLWDNHIEDTMSHHIFNNKYYYTYDALPGSLYHVLVKTVQKFPHKTAIIDNENMYYSYFDLLKLVDEFSSYLNHQIKISKGDHVGLMMYNSIEYCVSFLALSKIGAVTVALPSKFKEDEVVPLAEKAEVCCIICDKSFSDYFRNFKNTVKIVTSVDSTVKYGFSHLDMNMLDTCTSTGNLEDPALILFTSGTTSQSKCVEIRNFNMMHAILSYQRILNITSEDKSVIATPIYHITGLVALLGLFLYSGGCLYLHRKFEADKVLDCVKNHNITFLHASPTVFIKLLELHTAHPELPSLRSFACGSSNMPPEKLRQLHKWLPNLSFRTVYGLTETTSPATIFPGDACTSPFIGSSGFPIPGVEIKIVGEHGEELADNNIGEILLRGCNIINRYYNTDADAGEDDWLRTGDLGYLNSEHYLYIVDRKKDMINRGGEKIWSIDIENELCKIPDIMEAAVVGIPDAVYGEVPEAVIRVSTGASITPEEVKEILKDRLAKFQIPQKIIIADTIPKTPNDKVDKKVIRKLLTRQEDLYA